MLDPSGDAPWEEDPAAKNVVQISSEKVLNWNSMMMHYYSLLFVNDIQVLLKTASIKNLKPTI